jgi:SAM-dependent methyltransferase
LKHKSEENHGDRSYTKLAKYYDLIYDRIVDYETHTTFVEHLFKKFHKRGKVRKVLDIGCGTGNYAFVFAKRGYSATGIDLSENMITVAKEKLTRRSRASAKRRISNPRFFKMDMRSLTLDEKFDAATVMFGGFGYLLSYAEVRQCFASIKKSLNKNGLFILEFWHNTALRREASSKQGFTSFVRVQDHGKLVIRLDTNKFDPLTDICNIDFEIFVIDTKRKKLIDSFLENHRLKTYSISEIQNLLEENGFKALGFFENTLGASEKIEAAKQSSFRVLAVATPQRHRGE